MLTLLLCSFYWSSAQDNDFSNFIGIQAEGVIPDDFITSWNRKADQRYKESVNDQTTKYDKKVLERFWVQNHYFLNELLSSGLVSFGDPVTNYLNQIKDNVLKDDPELASKIRIYLFKSPITNASCTQEGILFINTGLVARAKTEAELAFVISHEITHYTQDHLIKEFFEKDAINEERYNKYDDISYIEKFNIVTERSQQNEFDADEKGMDLFLKSGYHIGGIEGTFDLLHQSYLPFEEKKVHASFLNTDNFELPLVYLKEELAPVSEEEDYFDETHSHPNIHRRRSTLDELLKYKDFPIDGKHFFQTEKEFYRIRELARFETVKQEVINGNYGNAIYHINFLRETYPNSKFLDISFGKALYGLACYKAVNKYKQVAKAYNKTEGESQQVHYVLRQFDRKQLASLTLHHMLSLIEKYPSEEYLNKYVDQLTELMFIKCKLKEDDFSVENASIGAFTKTSEDFKNERAYFRAKQKHYKDFYKYPLQQQLNSGWLEINLTKHQAKLDSLVMERKLTAKYKDKREDRKEEHMKAVGSGLRIKELVILDPYYEETGLEDVDDFYEALALEEGFKKKVLNISKGQGVKSIPLFAEYMKPEDIDDFNDFSELKQWIGEAYTFHSFDLIPTGIDAIYDKRINVGGRHICMPGGVVYSNRRRKSYYYFTVFDLKKGKVVYTRYEYLKRSISMTELEEELENDMTRINN